MRPRAAPERREGMKSPDGTVGLRVCGGLSRGDRSRHHISSVNHLPEVPNVMNARVK